MTRKNARKTAARARQQKTGQPYQSALRSEGGIQKPTDLEARIHQAMTVLNNGLYFTGTLAPTREELFGRIQLALHVLDGSSEQKIKEAIDAGQFEPRTGRTLHCPSCGSLGAVPGSGCTNGWHLQSRDPRPQDPFILSPAYKALVERDQELKDARAEIARLKAASEGAELQQPFKEKGSSGVVVCQNCGGSMYPRPVADDTTRWACPLCNTHQPGPLTSFTPKKPLQGFNITPKACEPQSLMNFFQNRPEARRCSAPRHLLMGVTDDHPVKKGEKPREWWTTMVAAKGCPGFSEWWLSLPEADPYCRLE